MFYKGLRKELPLYSPLILSRMRKKLYLTQENTAWLCHVKVATWRHWESGRSFMPDVAFAYFIKNVYNPIRSELKRRNKHLENLERPDEW